MKTLFQLGLAGSTIWLVANRKICTISKSSAILCCTEEWMKHENGFWKRQNQVYGQRRMEIRCRCCCWRCRQKSVSSLFECWTTGSIRRQWRHRFHKAQITEQTSLISTSSARLSFRFALGKNKCFWINNIRVYYDACLFFGNVTAWQKWQSECYVQINQKSKRTERCLFRFDVAANVFFHFGRTWLWNNNGTTSSAKAPLTMAWIPNQSYRLQCIRNERYGFSFPVHENSYLVGGRYYLPLYYECK